VLTVTVVYHSIAVCNYRFVILFTSNIFKKCVYVLVIQSSLFDVSYRGRGESLKVLFPSCEVMVQRPIISIMLNFYWLFLCGFGTVLIASAHNLGFGCGPPQDCYRPGL